MSLDAADLRELTSSLSDRLYLQIANWHLYLGDAGLAEALAIECSARLDQGDITRPVDQGHDLARTEPLGQHGGEDIGLVIIGEGAEYFGALDVLLQ